MTSVSIRNLTRSPFEGPLAIFSKIVKKILPDWDVSIVFVGPKKARKLNRELRHKDYIPNVLSYVVGRKSGEIFICLSEAAKQASRYNTQPTSYVISLFIHGVLHLKGMVHSDTMETCEKKLLKRHVKTRSNRNRHRHVSDKSRCR